MSDFDHSRIRADEDRSFTPRLMDVVLAGPIGTADWDEAAETLRWLEDPRTIRPLRAFVEDLSAPTEARRTIGRVLGSFDMTDTPAQRVAWWRSGDDVLAEHALGVMERSEASIVAAVAADPRHELQAVAMATMEWGFEEPEYQRLKVDGLRSDRPDVAAAAAHTVSWDEPLAGEAPLRDLLLATDPDSATRAAYSLQYFPSLETLDHLRQCAGRIHPEAEEQRAESVEFIVGSIRSDLERADGATRDRLQRWADAIGYPADDQEGEAGPPGRPRQPPPPSFDPVADPGRFEDVLDTTSGPFRPKLDDLRAVRWADVTETHRDRIGARLAGHPDPDVRALGTVALRHWDRDGALVDLLGDEHAAVRKSAMYALGQIEPRPGIAALALAVVGTGAGTAATEALTTYARHAAPAERGDELFELAGGDRRTSVRYAAIGLLDDTGEEERLARLLPLLHEAPEVNWDCHLALLFTRVARQADERRLRALVEVDNLDIACQAASVLSQIAGRGLRPV
jgi:hypothetical protein